MDYRVEHLEELETILDRLNINKSDIVLSGSEILAQLGIRKNNDLDIITRPEILKRNKDIFPNSYRWRINLSKNIELYRNHLFFIGISDNDIFTRHWYEKYNGYNMIPLEIAYLIKKKLKRDKDRLDIEMIESYDHNIRIKSKVYKQPPAKIILSNLRFSFENMRRGRMGYKI